MPDPPRNRRTRRADAKAKGQTLTPLAGAAATATETDLVDDIPLAQPDRSRPKTKTLFDIAGERNALLAKGQPFSPMHGDGLVRDEQGRVVLPPKDDLSVSDFDHGVAAGDEDVEQPVGPLGDAIFYTVGLGMLHFTLAVLVQHQYGIDKPTLTPLVLDTVRTVPLLGIAVYGIKRGEVASRTRLKQVVHFVLGVGAGCYLLWIGNKANYLAVMKRAPAVGTVWVWNVIEMRLEWAVASLVLCVGYLWWNGLSIT